MSEQMPSYDEYAVFNKEKEPAPLPFEGMEDLDAFKIEHGGFSSVIVREKDRIIKIFRVIRWNHYAEVTDQNPSNYSFLKPKGKKQDANLKNAVDSIYEYQKIIDKHFQIQKKYIKKFLPNKYGTVVAESPRNELAKRFLRYREDRERVNEVLKIVPNSEIALIEVWENIGSENAIESMPFDTIERIYKNENFKKEMKEFSESVLEMLKNEGVMIDLCDSSGIRTVKDEIVDGRRGDLTEGITTLDDTLQFIDGSYPKDQIAVPRNLSFGEKGVKYYDTFPIWTSSTQFSTEQIQHVIKIVQEKDIEKVKDFVENEDTGDTDDRHWLVNYVALLDSFKNLP